MKRKSASWAGWSIAVLVAGGALIATAGMTRAVDTIETYVGGGNGDGDAAINAIIDPRGLVAVGDPARPHLYIADGKNNRVRRVDGVTGLIDTVAGNGVAAYGGDGGQGQNASIRFPLDVAVDAPGNLFIVDYFNSRIRKVNTSGTISTFAGTGVPAFNGDGLATSSAVNNPYGVTIGPDGNVYIADFGNNRIRKVSPPNCTPSSCVMSTVAGTGGWGYAGDGGQATAATMRNPSDVVFDASGNMFITDWGNHRVRRVAPNGVITTVAGGGQYGPGSNVNDGGIATAAVLSGPAQVAVDVAQNIYIADTNHRRIRRLRALDQASYIIDTVAGTGGTGSGGDGGLAVNADLYSIWGVAATTTGTFWLSQTTELPLSLDNRVRQVQSFGIIQSVVGGGLGDGSAATNAIVDPRGGEAVPAGGPFPDLYFADGANNVVRRVNGSTGDIHTLAGTGVAGYSGDGGDANNAKLRSPLDVARDQTTGHVYVSDTFNNVIRKIDGNGVITTVAGTGVWGWNGDNRPATTAQLKSPRGIDVDNSGNLYICDYENYRVRKVSGGQITTVAGNGNWGDTGDGGLAVNAALRGPWDVVVAPDGTIYISDPQSGRIRRISTGGVITSVNAGMNNPTMLSLSNAGLLYIAEGGTFRIKSTNPASCVWPALCGLTTVAGNGQSGASGDGGSPLAASFSEPTGVAIDPNSAFLFIGSKDDDRVRVVQFGGPPPPTPTPSFTAIPPTPTNTGIPPTATRTGTSTRTGTATHTPVSSSSVSGQVKYYSNGLNVPNVAVGLDGPIDQTAQTAANGTYSATGIPMGTWNLEPAKLGGTGSAISSLDAARVLQVIAGLQTFTSLQRLACDVTGDGSLSALDAVRILQFSAGIIQRMPAADMCGSDWLFNPTPEQVQNQTVTPPSVSGGVCRPGGIELDPLAAPVDDQNFDAILMGDCTGNWNPSQGGSLRRVAPGGATVHVGRLRRTGTHSVRLPMYVRTAAPFQSLDLLVRYDTAALTFTSARLRTDAPDVLLGARSDGDGTLSVSLASAEPIDASGGALLYVDFNTATDECTEVRVGRAAIDERAARVVTHGDCN